MVKSSSIHSYLLLFKESSFLFLLLFILYLLKKASLVARLLGSFRTVSLLLTKEFPVQTAHFFQQKNHGHKIFL